MTGIEIIEEERKRQIEKEGWTPEHDDEHSRGELANAARCYSGLAADQERMRVYAKPARTYQHWPWSREWWKPSEDPIRNLAKAGALIAAEIDRLQRKNG